MYGAIIGDIAGSVIEFEGIKRKDLPIPVKGDTQCPSNGDLQALLYFS